MMVEMIECSHQGEGVVDQGDASTTASDDDVVQRGILLALRLIGAAMGKEEEL
jgi:hypothetical protein